MEPQSTLLDPWCNVGFDETSKMKMKTDFKFIIKYDSTFVAIDSSLPPIKEILLSARDQASIEKLTLIPISNKNILIAVLIIADSPYFEGSSSENSIIFESLQSLLRQVINTHNNLCSRQLFIETYTLSDDCIDNSTSQKIEKFISNKMIVVKIDNLSSFVIKDFSNLILASLQKDILKRCINILQRYTELVIKNNSSIFVILTELATCEADYVLTLFIKEMTKSIGHFLDAEVLLDYIFCMNVGELKVLS